MVHVVSHMDDEHQSKHKPHPCFGVFIAWNIENSELRGLFWLIFTQVLIILIRLVEVKRISELRSIVSGLFLNSKAPLAVIVR